MPLESKLAVDLLYSNFRVAFPSLQWTVAETGGFGALAAVRSDSL